MSAGAGYQATGYQPALANLTPADLDLPEKFKEFRRTQVEGVDFALGRGSGPGGGITKRFQMLSQPGGSGKSITAMTLGRISGCKFVILTGTRALEAQYMKDFGSCGLVNIQGRANYPCRDPELTKLDGATGVRGCELNCDEGYERGCKFADSKLCTYRGKVAEAVDTDDGIVSNYQYWMNVRGRNPHALETTGNPITLLICDEFHMSGDEASRHISAWLPHKYAHEHGGELFRKLIDQARGEASGRVNDQWVMTLLAILRSIRGEMGRLEFDYGNEYAAFRQSKRYRGLKKVAGDLEKITTYGGDGNWLWLQSQDYVRQTGVRFECVWPGRYMERYVWSGVPRVVGLSATLRPMAMSIAGLNDSKYAFKEWPRQFPAENNPVVWVKTGGMGKNASSDELRESILMADRLYDEWAPKTNILVQTASYKRAEWLAQNSRWGRHMLINKPGEAAQTAEKFMKSPPPCLLVSGSYTTGWDMSPAPGTWGLVHVLKLPFPDRSDPVVRARAESDDQWYAYATAQTFQQSTLRQTRNPDDKSMVVVTDDAVGRFRNYARRHFSTGFVVRDAGGIPRYPGPG
jgi:hypothetical protein